MKIAVYGSSLLSAYWNGAATYYRGILGALAARGAEIAFYEPDALDRQAHRDIAPPDWCRVVVYPATDDGVAAVAADAAGADVAIKTSGVGYADDALLAQVFAHARDDALKVWWDVDAPATLAAIDVAEDHPLRAALPQLDLVLTYGGGEAVRKRYFGLGAKDCVAVYNALDPATHHPVPPEPRFACDLGLLANRLPDREARIDEFFLGPAAELPGARFLLGGSGWEDKALPPAVARLGHVGTALHNAFNCSARAVLNVTRDSMAATGYSPPTRLFEAAGAGACVITDAWRGIEMFLTPGQEVLVARDAADVVEALGGLTPERAREIGAAALGRVRAEHTYDRRAAALAETLTAALAAKRGDRAA